MANPGHNRSSDQAWIITGPTSGIGRRTALELAKHGTNGVAYAAILCLQNSDGCTRVQHPSPYTFSADPTVLLTRPD